MAEEIRRENAAILKSTSKEYFLSLTPLKPFDTSMLDDELIVGKFIPDLGYYVLPSDEENDDAYDI